MAHTFDDVKIYAWCMQGLRCGIYTNKPTAACQICLCDGVPAQLRPCIPPIPDLFVYPEDAMRFDMEPNT
jgi:hypothetical protein